MKKEIKFKDVVREVRRLVEECPDAVYKRQQVDGRNFGVCKYAGGSAGGEVGCLFGQAFRNLGVSEDDLKKWDDRGGVTAGYALELLDCDRNQTQEFWADEVQSCQDTGEEWKEALRSADRLYPIPF